MRYKDEHHHSISFALHRILMIYHSTYIHSWYILHIYTHDIIEYVYICLYFSTHHMYMSISHCPLCLMTHDIDIYVQPIPSTYIQCTANPIQIYTIYMLLYIMSVYMYSQSHVEWDPIFESSVTAQSSKLKGLFLLKSGNRAVQALSFVLWNSIQKCHPKWDWLYCQSHSIEWLAI